MRRAARVTRTARCWRLLLSIAGVRRARRARRRADLARPTARRSTRPAPLSLEAAREAHRAGGAPPRAAPARGGGAGLLPARDARRARRRSAWPRARSVSAELADLGQLLFEHEYGFADGLGGGAAATAPAGPFRRVHAARSADRRRSPVPRATGSAARTAPAPRPTTRSSTATASASASGDERNPPALVALGVVQALAREMSRDLQQQRADLVREAARAGDGARSPPGRQGRRLRRRCARRRRASSTRPALRGVDADLVVKPFGWKGTLADLRRLRRRGAAGPHRHPERRAARERRRRELLGDGSDPADPDGDGVRGELGRGPFTAMIVHLALLELPIVEPLIQDRQLAAAADGAAAADDDELRRRLPARPRAVPRARLRRLPRADDGAREPDRSTSTACRRSTSRARCGSRGCATTRPRRLSGVAVQRSQAPRHGEGQRRPARAARRRARRTI